MGFSKLIHSRCADTQFGSFTDLQDAVVGFYEFFQHLFLHSRLLEFMFTLILQMI